MKRFLSPRPTFSVVACSHIPERGLAIKAHYDSLFDGYSYEFIGIDDARSLCEGYARGFRRSSGRLVIFSHDDIEFVTADVPARLQSHLETFDVIGVAGTTRLIDAVWTSSGDPNVFGFVIYPTTEGNTFDLRYVGRGPLCVPDVQAMDGCFLACKREVVDAVGFDDVTFDGFHYYDMDFTFGAYLQGYRLGVCRDLALIHQSQGNPDPTWLQYRDRFLEKYRGRFAIGTPNAAQTVSARVPRTALAQVCRPENLINAIQWQ